MEAVIYDAPDRNHLRFRYIAEKFDAYEGCAPTCVRRFVEDTSALRDRTPEQWQQDAFGQIDALMRVMTLRD